MDRGYSWVVFVAAFITNGMIFGFVSSFGLFFNAIMDEFQADRKSVGLAGGVLNGILLISGRVIPHEINELHCSGKL